MAVDIEILELGEVLENDRDDVLPLAVVHGHHLGREGDRDRTDPSGEVRVIDHRPSEGGDASQGQVDLVVQPASSFMTEELTDETNLTESAEGLDQSDNVAVELERETPARNDCG